MLEGTKFGTLVTLNNEICEGAGDGGDWDGIPDGNVIDANDGSRLECAGNPVPGDIINLVG